MLGTAIALAIVIPAYRARFLPAALASVAAQTDQRFRLYICDDGSPEDLRLCCDAFALSPERVTYRRFEPNMGARHLVRHWNRSVEQVAEPWVWLFSDDDVMEPTCVETFLRAVESDGDAAANVYRFNTLVIDAAGRVTRINPPHPARESTLAFTYHRLTGQRQSYAPDHVFRRAAWERHGGFVDLPYAQGSDDASWITFAGDRPLTLLDGPCVRWRLSATNISGDASGYVGRIRGLVEFALWLRQHFAGQPLLPADAVCTFDFDQVLQDWLYAVLRHRPAAYSARELRALSLLLREKLAVPRYRSLRAMLSLNGHLVVRKFPSALRRVFLRRPVL